jgi:hypothetical protein
MSFSAGENGLKWGARSPRRGGFPAVRGGPAVNTHLTAVDWVPKFHQKNSVCALLAPSAHCAVLLPASCSACYYLLRVLVRVAGSGGSLRGAPPTWGSHSVDNSSLFITKRDIRARAPPRRASVRVGLALPPASCLAGGSAVRGAGFRQAAGGATGPVIGRTATVGAHLAGATLASIEVAEHATRARVVRCAGSGWRIGGAIQAVNPVAPGLTTLRFVVDRVAHGSGAIRAVPAAHVRQAR